MTQVVVGSAFRNSAGRQVKRWLDQVESLAGVLDVRAMAVEGDSTDATRQELLAGAKARGLDFELRTANHGGPVYGSTEDPKRMAALSFVLNEAMAGIRETDDVLFYVESDLLWDAATAAALVELVASGAAEIVAPMTFAGEHFYDVWACRKDGSRFSPLPPYHAGLNAKGLTEVDSVGSCVVMRGEIAQKVRVKDGNAFVGWCAEALAQGHRIDMAAELSVRHPC